jgi:GNAT superfamily N-acetyltransferase
MELVEATIRDLDSVTDFIRAMLQDMVSYGGHALNEDHEVSLQLETRFTEACETEDHVFLLAVGEGAEGGPVGVIEASVGRPTRSFYPMSVLHIHSIYVEPSYRRAGIGQRLLQAALEWGRGKGCEEAELNVLVRNPARMLYEDAGFEVFELELRRKL